MERVHQPRTGEEEEMGRLGEVGSYPSGNLMLSEESLLTSTPYYLSKPLVNYLDRNQLSLFHSNSNFNLTGLNFKNSKKSKLAPPSNQPTIHPNFNLNPNPNPNPCPNPNPNPNCNFYTTTTNQQPKPLLRSSVSLNNFKISSITSNTTKSSGNSKLSRLRRYQSTYLDKFRGKRESGLHKTIDNLRPKGSKNSKKPLELSESVETFRSLRPSPIKYNESGEGFSSSLGSTVLPDPSSYSLELSLEDCSTAVSEILHSTNSLTLSELNQIQNHSNLQNYQISNSNSNQYQNHQPISNQSQYQLLLQVPTLTSAATSGTLGTLGLQVPSSSSSYRSPPPSNPNSRPNSHHNSVDSNSNSSSLSSPSTMLNSVTPTNFDKTLLPTGPPSPHPIPPKKEEDPKDYLRYLETTFSKSELGSLLSKKDQFHHQVLDAFMDSLSFTDVAIDMALRNLLSVLYLPKEGQQIDRILTAFSERYHEANKGLFSSQDVVYSLSFSILLLHTDAHNKLVKRKMTKKEYLQLAGQLDSAIPVEILDILYDNVTHQEFLQNDEIFDSHSHASDYGRRSWYHRWQDSRNPLALLSNTSVAPQNHFAIKVSTLMGATHPESLPFHYHCPFPPPEDRPHHPTSTLRVKGIASYFQPQSSLHPASELAFHHVDEVADITELKCFREGVLLRKSDLNEFGRKTHIRAWREFWAVVAGNVLLLFREVSTLRYRHRAHQPFVAPKPYSVTPLTNTIALLDHEYTKHDHTFRFVTGDERQYLFRADSVETRLAWLAQLNLIASFSTADVYPPSLFPTSSTPTTRCTGRLQLTLAHLQSDLTQSSNDLTTTHHLLHQLKVMVILTPATQTRVLAVLDRLHGHLRETHLRHQRCQCYSDTLKLALDLPPPTVPTTDPPTLPQLPPLPFLSPTTTESTGIPG